MWIVNDVSINNRMEVVVRVPYAGILKNEAFAEYARTIDVFVSMGYQRIGREEINPYGARILLQDNSNNSHVITITTYRESI